MSGAYYSSTHEEKCEWSILQINSLGEAGVELITVQLLRRRVSGAYYSSTLEEKQGAELITVQLLKEKCKWSLLQLNS